MSRVKTVLRHHPFALFGVFTIIVGAVWHSPLVPIDVRPVLTPAITVMGYPFIWSMRTLRETVGVSVWTPLIGTMMGFVPYALADVVLRIARRHRTTAGTTHPD